MVLTGNFGYCAEREFAAVVEAAGTPFVALHKENVRPPKRIAYWHHLYKERRGPFAGRRVLVYNDIERELEIASMVAAPEKIVVTGMPRLDRIHRWRRQNVGATKDRTRPQVLFLAFARYEKLTGIQRKPAAGIAGDMELIEGEDWGKLSWSELGEDSHRAMVELARRRPDISVIVKTKGQRRKKDDILAMLQFAADNMPPNLKIVDGGDPFDLMVESRVVIGFNTTGLLEAIAAGKPVIVPWFGEAQDSAMSDHIIDLDECRNLCAIAGGTHPALSGLRRQSTQSSRRAQRDGVSRFETLGRQRRQRGRRPRVSGDQRRCGVQPFAAR